MQTGAMASIAMIALCAGLLWPSGAGAVFPGTNGLLVYQGPDSGGEQQIWTASSNGTGTKQLTSDPGGATEPAWSPDGSKIAFVTGSGHIAVMSAAGQNVVDVTPGDAPGSVVDGSPAWSPDGSKLAFSRIDYGQAAPEYDIWVMNADGSGQSNLTAGTGEDSTQPAWAPNGSKIAFVRSGHGKVWTMNPDGSGQTNISGAADFDDSDPTWSPDSSRLVFSMNAGGSASELWLINPDGSGERQLTSTGDLEEEHATFSPDGKSIIAGAETPPDGPSDLYTVDPATGSEAKIAGTTGAVHPDWQAGTSSQPQLPGVLAAAWPALRATQLTDLTIPGLNIVRTTKSATGANTFEVAKDALTLKFHNSQTAHPSTFVLATSDSAAISALSAYQSGQSLGTVTLDRDRITNASGPTPFEKLTFSGATFVGFDSKRGELALSYTGVTIDFPHGFWSGPNSGFGGSAGQSDIRLTVSAGADGSTAPLPISLSKAASKAFFVAGSAGTTVHSPAPGKHDTLEISGFTGDMKSGAHVPKTPAAGGQSPHVGLGIYLATDPAGLKLVHLAGTPDTVAIDITKQTHSGVKVVYQYGYKDARLVDIRFAGDLNQVDFSYTKVQVRVPKQTSGTGGNSTGGDTWTKPLV